MAGKSKLNRLELLRAARKKYRKIAHDPAATEGLFVDLLIEAPAKAPRQITLDLDATDDPVHGDQEGQFFATPTTTATAICRFMCSAAHQRRQRRRGDAGDRADRCASPGAPPSGRTRTEEFYSLPFSLASRGGTP